MNEHEPVAAPRGLCPYCGLPRFTANDLRRWMREKLRRDRRRGADKLAKFDPPWARGICFMSGGPHPKRTVKVEQQVDDSALAAERREK